MRVAVAFFLLIGCLRLVGQDIPEPMKPVRLVNDYAGILSEQDLQALERKLVAYDDSTSTQIAVVIVNSIGGYDPVDYAQRLGEKWGVGRKEGRKNNGIVVLVSVKDRKAAIATGYGMEGAIPDITTREIRENFMNPNFREGDFYKGLDQATTALIQYAAGEYKSTGSREGKEKSNGWGAIIFIIIVLVGIRIMGAMARTRKNHYGKKMNFWTAFWLMSSFGGMGGRGGGSSWGGGSGGGGGFGGFGGGSFGGGGSGGSW